MGLARARVVVVQRSPGLGQDDDRGDHYFGNTGSGEVRLGRVGVLEDVVQQSSRDVLGFLGRDHFGDPKDVAEVGSPRLIDLTVVVVLSQRPRGSDQIGACHHVRPGSVAAEGDRCDHRDIDLGV